MRQIILTAMNSGAGKTMVTCTLISLLKERGLNIASFKCGPDYIDPMFHRTVLGVSSENLDFFLQGRDEAEKIVKHTNADIAVFEGAMGYFDGVNFTTENSAFDISKSLGITSVLVVNPRGASVSVAAQIKGMLELRKGTIKAVILNRCSTSLYTKLKPIIESECDVIVVGYVPEIEELNVGSRHLGLITADEINDLQARFSRAGKIMVETIDIDLLLSLCSEQKCTLNESYPESKIRLGIAKDRAFCFYYKSALDNLRRCGAELVFFSPMQDKQLPECDGIYLGGGYPELYLSELSRNKNMLNFIREAVLGGMPTIAECGGFMYLNRHIEGCEMAGVFGGKVSNSGRLKRFGYAHLKSEKNSMLFRVGESVPVHEFHYCDSTENGDSLTAIKPNGTTWKCAFTSDTMYAGFPHLYLNETLAQRFIRACEKHKNLRKGGAI